MCLINVFVSGHKREELETSDNIQLVFIDVLLFRFFLGEV